MRDATIARNYAEALLSLARKADNTSGFASLIAAVAGAIESDQSLRDFLASPKVSVVRKNEVITKALAERAPRPFVLFITAVMTRRRQMLLPAIAAEYHTLLDLAEGRVHAQVTVSRETDDAGRDAIARELSRALGKEVVPHLTVNPAILGGVVVKVGDRVMDGSVRRRLATLRSRLRAGRAE